MPPALRSTRVLLGDHLRPATVVITEGHIAEIAPHDARPPGTVDHGDLVIMPALVDSHVHVNEPGRTHWEGFATATAAARAGGVALIADMPLNSIPPTTSVAALQAKRAAAEAAPLQCDVAFWGGIVPGNLDEVPALARAGVRGFKCFLVDSGVPEFPAVPMEDLPAVMAAAAAVGLPLLVHAEAPAVIAAAPAPGPDYPSYLASRPPSAEVEAVTAVAAAALATGGRAHIVHLASADALPVVAAAREAGAALTVETCPHYLTLSAEEVGDDLTAKCAPPIRDAANRERLWEGLRSGVIDMVVSDHSPCPADLKHGGFAAAWGGIASLELRLALTWSGAVSRGFGIADLARWTATAPGRLLGLGSGTIAPGRRADLVVWDPDAPVVVSAPRLSQRHPIGPYEGRSLRGRVIETIVRGGLPPIPILEEE